jgi:integrase
MARSRDLWKDPARKGHGKRWLAVWTDPDGRERSKAFARQADADKYAAAQETDVLRGTYIDPRALKITVSVWCDTWIAGYSARPKTVALAESHIVRIKAEFGKMPLASVRASQVKAWMAKLAAEDLADSYRYVLHTRLSQIMADAVHDGLLAKSPCSRRTSPAAGKQRAYVATTKQVWRLHDEMPGRLRAAVLLGAFAGLRTAEVCGLRPSDVDLIAGMVHPQVQWPAEPLKTEVSCTAVPIPASMCEALLSHMAEYPAPTVLTGPDGGQLPPWALVRAVQTARAKVPGLPEGFRHHDLRHYFASLLIASGCDIKTVQARLRHASAKTTLDTYGHLWPDKDESTRAAVEAIFAARTEQ